MNEIIIKILAGAFGHVAASIIHEGVKKVLEKDPFEKAFKESVEKVEKKYDKDLFFVFGLLQKPEAFVGREIIDKGTFCEILSEEGVIEYVASELYDEISKKFNEIIKETRKKNEYAFRCYVTEELEKQGLTLGVIEDGIRILTEITIPRIETILEKEKSKDAEFFRSWGPEWIDFEKGFVVERPEVNEILKKFENNNLIVINQGKDVYAIELKHTIPEIKEVLKLKKGYLFIDDAHLDFGFVDKIRQMLSNSVKVLASTRDINEDSIQVSHLKLSEYIRDAILIKSVDAREEIIENFLKIEKQGETMSGKIKEKLSKESLWVLAWQLRAYKETGNVDRDAVCREVENYLDKLKEQGIENPEDIFLILSVFYKYEIPVRQKFVEKLVCGSKKGIEKLIKIREINETKEKGWKYLGLHHSEIAEVYLDLFRNPEFEGVGEEMKKKVEEETGKEWFEGLFHWYIREFPKEGVDVITGVSFEESRLIKNMVEENFDEVKNSIGAKDDVGEIGWCVGEIAHRNEKIAEKLVKSLDLENLKKKIEMEEDVKEILGCILGVGEGSKEVAEKLIPVVKNRIEVEEDAEKIGEYILAEVFVNNIKEKIFAENVEKKIEAEKGVEEFFSCIGSKEVVEKLVKILDIKNLKKKTEAERDIRTIGCRIGGVAWGSEEVAEKLIPVVKSRIEMEEDIEKIGWCIVFIAIGSKKIAEDLTNDLNLEILKSKIEAEEDVKKIDWCIKKIACVSGEVTSKLVNQLDLEKAKTPEVREKIIELKKQYQR